MRCPQLQAQELLRVTGHCVLDWQNGDRWVNWSFGSCYAQLVLNLQSQSQLVAPYAFVSVVPANTARSSSRFKQDHALKRELMAFKTRYCVCVCVVRAQWQNELHPGPLPQCSDCVGCQSAKGQALRVSRGRGVAIHRHKQPREKGAQCSTACSYRPRCVTLCAWMQIGVVVRQLPMVCNATVWAEVCA